MTANLGRWEIRTIPAKREGDGHAPEYRIVRTSRTVTVNEPDLDQTVGDFITRHVLERDLVLFQG